MKPSDDREAAAIFDFIDEYLSDLDGGGAKPLAHYLARFKGFEEAVAREYLTLRGGERAEHAAASAPADADERRIGPYRLIRELGRGGQGSVWLAEDVRIARKVALKVLASRFESVSEDKRRRFRREAEVIAQLEHPSICPIYDADIECDTPWIAMRFVEGKTLAQLLGEARAERESDAEAAAARAEEAAQHDSQDSEVTTSWPPKSTLDVHRTLLLFERCARALHAAHEAGVIHRDVKPGNLIVTPDGKPVILDFGLARHEGADEGQITESGEVFGTPAYMSPEQLGGPSEELDRRTDVYSLGVALYEALTLKRPFDKGGNKAALYTAIRDEAPADPRGENAALTLDVKVVLETALDKDRTRRYASALELAEDLRRIREYEPIHARPASVPLKLARWIRKHPALATSLIGTIVVLAVGLTVALVLNVQLQSALEVALGNHLAQRARALTREDPSAALTLGIQAVEKAPSDLTREALVEALAACRLKTVIAPSQHGRRPGRMRDLAVSPAGNRVAIAFESGAIELYDTTRFELQGQFPGRGSAAIALAWAPEDRALIAAYADGHVARWDPATGRLAMERRLAIAPSRVEVDPKGSALLVVGDSNTTSGSGARFVHVLDPSTLEPRAGTDGGAHPIDDARLAPSGDRFVAWSRGGGAFAVYATADARELALTTKHVDVSSVDVDSSASALRVALGTKRGEVFVLDEHLRIATQVVPGLARTERRGSGVPHGGNDGRESGGAEPVELVRIRGAHVFASCAEQEGTPAGLRRSAARAFLVHVATSAIREFELDASSGAVEAQFSPDGREIALVDRDHRIHVVDVASLARDRFVRGFFMPAQLAWCRFGRMLFTRTNGPFTHVWHAHGAPGVPSIWPRAREERPLSARGAVLAPDGDLLVADMPGAGRLAWRRDDERFRLDRDVNRALPPEGRTLLEGWEGVQLPPIPAGIDVIDPATWVGAFQPDARALWSVGATTLRLELPLEDRASSVVNCVPGALRAWAVSLDGRAYGALYETGDVVVQHASEQEPAVFADPLHRAEEAPPHPMPRVESARVIGLALDDTGERTALCLTDGRVRVVETRSGRVLHLLDDPKARGVVATCAFRPGTDELAVYGSDKRLRFWNAATGAKVRDDVVLFDPRSIAYSRDGKLLLATGRTGGGALRVFELDPFTAVSFKTHHTSSLTAGEFSADGRFVLTAARDGTVFVRESTTGGLFARRVFEAREVVDAHFGGPAEELSVVATTDDGAVHVWPVDPLPVAKRRYVRELDGGEVERERRLASPLEYP